MLCVFWAIINFTNTTNIRTKTENCIKKINQTHLNRMKDFGNERLFNREKYFFDAVVDVNVGVKYFPFP